MVDATPAPVNRILSIHKEPPDFSRPDKYHKNFIQVKPPSMAVVASLITKAVWSDCIWQEGKRCERNFTFSDYCVLDVDGGYNLDSAINELCDTAHVIATTKSHSDHEHRFRIVMPWTNRITSLDVYRFNVERGIKRYDADPAGIDGARFFWPCREVKSVAEIDDVLFLQDVLPLPADYISHDQKQLDAFASHLAWKNRGLLSPSLQNALRREPANGQRNNTIYWCAKQLTYYGHTFDQIMKIILKSPIPLPTAPKKEIELAIKSGMKKAIQIMSEAKGKVVP